MKTIKIGIVFGVFDGFHAGHRYFLESAKKKCDTLIVVVAQDETSLALKGRLPVNTLDVRMQALNALGADYKIVLGDEDLGQWSVIKKYAPDAVILGYDQKKLSEEIKTLGISVMFVQSHQPDTFKSSLITKNKTRTES